MPIGRDGLAIGTEIGIVTHSALVAITNDVGLITLTLAKRTITEDAVVLLAAAERRCNDLINRNEPVTWVGMASTLDASSAIVPIRTVHAFVANTIDMLLEVSTCA